jgi:hypothetical protein
MVDVLRLDSICIFVCGEKVLDIDCSHLLLRDKLCDKRSNTMHKELAKEHGAHVLQTANKDIVDRYGEALFGVNGGNGDGRSFVSVFSESYSLLLHKVGKSTLLQQGADKSAASLRLNLVKPSKTTQSKKRRAQSTKEPADQLPVLSPSMT